MAEDEDSENGFSNFTRNSSSSASIGGRSSRRSSRRSREKKVIVVHGTVSNMLGKDYASSSNNRTGVWESNMSAVLEKVQAWEVMPPDLSAPRNEDVMAMFGTCSSSNNDIQQGDISFMGGNRSYASAVANCGTRPLSVSEISSEDEQDNWENVVKNKSPTQRFECPPKVTANGDDYQDCRITASRYWDSMRALWGQAEFARANGRWDETIHYENQAKMLRNKAEQADEMASQDIFDLCNGIQNRMKIDLRGQNLAEGMRILKLHLIFGVYQRSLWQLQVITGYGSHGSRPSVLKQSVLDLLKEENIKCEEENTGSLLITFDGHKRVLGFVECEDNDCEDGYSYSTYTSSSNASSASSSTGSIDSMSSRRSRGKKVISVSGSVSNITGKEYLYSSNKKIGVQERNVVEKVQAWEAMSASSNTSEDVMVMLGTSSVASSSNNDLEEGDISFVGGDRSYAGVVASCGPHPPSGPKTSFEQKTQNMSDTIYALEKRLIDELQLGQNLDDPSEDTPKKQHVPEDSCQNQRITPSHFGDSANSSKEKVRLASENARWDDAKDYDNWAWEAMPKSSNTSEDVKAVFGTSSSSNNDLQEYFDLSFMGSNRSYANCGPCPPSGPETSSEQMTTTQDMSEGYYKRLSDKLQEELDNQKNLVKNELRRQKLDYPSPKTQHIPGEDCQNQRITATQYRDSAKALKEKVGFACKNGRRDEAKVYDNKARMFEKMAQQAEEKASQDIFDSRNKGFKNRMQIDLHGQRLKEGLLMLKQHLIFGVYRRSLWQLKVITGYGSHGTGPSVLRKAVVRLLQEENVKWQEEEENRGSLLITFDGQKKELSFI
ncbi:hypothetical protein L1887_38754 [Cichorium endivia]|nr:hypothetical protein L1887_38754 [Cichorium endivia]